MCTHYKCILHTYASRFLSTPHSIAHTHPDLLSSPLVPIVTGIDGKGTSCQSSQSDSTISRIGQLTTRFCSVQIMSIQLVSKQLTCAGPTHFLLCMDPWITREGRKSCQTRYIYIYIYMLRINLNQQTV